MRPLRQPVMRARRRQPNRAPWDRRRGSSCATTGARAGATAVSPTPPPAARPCDAALRPPPRELVAVVLPCRHDYPGPVARLLCFRGIDYLTALALVCEVGDFRLFATAPQF